ncbi:hypothetical protein ACIPVK_02260 [Paeniglutamicibacter sp. MACA_103]|uniref:hypothetical protein n=1 Tax=Paeniglutamicibacter sp. MACA_103 TaxID=3377337 RepID=UPI0038959565
MKRFLGLLLALAVLLPMGNALGWEAIGSVSPIHADAAPAAATAHCPTDMPTKHHCEPSADPQLNLAQIAPRPDASGTFGALPATPATRSGYSDPQQARAPDLHALSISRT